MDDYNERPQDQPQPEQAPEAPSGEDAPARRPGAGLFEWLQLLAGGLLAAVLVFSCLARITVVDGHSMDPTLQNGEMMLIWSLGYRPKQGDIVVLTKTAQDTLPQVKDKAIVKRVIAVGGQTVDIDYTTGTVYVDGAPLDEPYINGPMYLPGDPMMWGTHWEVPEGSIFVMGDNRNGSTDSRHELLGTIDEDYILGKVVLALWPPDRFGPI